MGFLLVFDVTNETSFLNVRNWIGEIQSNAYSENVNMILVGNKCDLETERVITKSRALELAQQCQIDYIETSALQNLNIAETIELLLDSVMNRLEENDNFSKRKNNIPKKVSEQIHPGLSERDIKSKKKNVSYCCNY
jgi:GTPase SAR1 family protein